MGRIAGVVAADTRERSASSGHRGWSRPDRQVTDELILTIALPVGWLGNFFTQKDGG
jgi:hypothetical protein